MTALLGLGLVGLFLLQIRDFNGNFSKHRIPTIILFLLFGLIPAFSEPQLSGFLLQGLGIGLAMIVAYLLLARFEPKLILIAFIGVAVLHQIANAILGYTPNAWLYAGVQSVALCVTAYWWLRLLERGEDVRV